MYDIKEEQKTIYSATSSGTKNIIRYEFYRSGEGWWIEKEHNNVDSPFPDKSQMYVSNEVIEKILLVQTAKTTLND
jgi:hypothetical protein